jgi:Protein of unknown function (DUF2934)
MTKSGKQPARSVPKDKSQTVSTVGARHEDIATAACYRAQSRGFSSGGELIDWLEAERQINAAVKKIQACRIGLMPGLVYTQTGKWSRERSLWRMNRQ